jgi:hypothetical protein
VIVANGIATEPEMDIVAAVPKQNPVLVIGNATLELDVSVCVGLLHVLPPTDTLSQVMVQAPLPILMRAFSVITSTDVVLVAVAVHDALDVITVAVPRLLVQPNVGPARVPAAFVVWARAPVALTFRSVVHVKVNVPEVRVSVPCPCTTVPGGSQFAAEAVEAPVSAITIEAATTAVPNVFMPSMLLSFIGSGGPTYGNG